ncbi:hypothetical protein NDA01_26465 [Trichocoleus desertorum AS-A10]|uniref:hypothetical protein n=1 Tax=Trichocoleus desertorum TaxID=1481672 RepID=UPI003299B688
MIGHLRSKAIAPLIKPPQQRDRPPLQTIGTLPARITLLAVSHPYSDRFKRTPQPDANLGPMPESSKSGVEVPSAAYEQMSAYWSVISAVRGGTSEIRDRGEAFLPLEPFEKDTAYLRRRNRSCLTPWYARLVRGLVGMVLRKPVKVEAGSKTTEHLDNINLLGDDLNTFAHEVFEAAIDHGYTGIFVDYPRSDGIQLLSEQIAAGLRPYWVHYTAPEIIGWRYEIQGNLRRFTQLRIREVVTEEDGEFSDRQVEAAIEAGKRFMDHWLSNLVIGLMYDELYDQGHIDHKEYRRLSDSIGEVA